jgi:CRP-like cAMP-binding protein
LQKPFTLFARTNRRQTGAFDVRQCAELVRVFEFEGDLLEQVPARERAPAERHAVASCLRFERGQVEFPLGEPEHRGIGFLVLDGFLLRHVECFGERMVELVGEGDVIRLPVVTSSEIDARATVTWEAVEDVAVANLDEAFARDIARWPGVAATLIDRVAERAMVLAAQLAIAKIRNLDARLLCLLWFAAQRWGTMSREGLAVRLPFSQEVLAELASARRPSVSLSLKRLRDQGIVQCRNPSTWVLSHDAVVRGCTVAESVDAMTPALATLSGRRTAGAHSVSSH